IFPDRGNREDDVRLFLAATAVSICALTGLAGAETFNASSVRVEHAAAMLTVIAEDRSTIDVDVSGGGGVAAPSVRLANGAVVVDGGLRNRIRECSGSGVRIAGVGAVPR